MTNKKPTKPSLRAEFQSPVTGEAAADPVQPPVCLESTQALTPGGELERRVHVEIEALKRRADKQVGPVTGKDLLLQREFQRQSERSHDTGLGR